MQARPLRPDERDRAAAVLATAFHDDPLMRWVLPDDARRRRQLPWLQGTVVRYCLRYGIATTTGALDGVACWLPPGATSVSVRKALLTGSAAMPLHLGASGFRRLLRFEQLAEQVHHREAPGPHWYLYLLGVDPAAQGRGVASALLAPQLAAADAAGLPAYLETQAPENPPLYAHFGFRVVAEHTLGDGVRSWAMRREPV